MMDEQAAFHRFAHPRIESIYQLAMIMPHEFFKKILCFLAI